MLLALAKFDAAIATSAVRQISRRVSDGLTLLVVLPLLALFARSWLATLPDDLRELGAFAVASLLATLLAKVLIERLWFHRTDGVLARDAQRPRDGLAYVVPLLLVGIAMGLSTLAMLGLVDPGGMALGVCSGLPVGVLFPFVREHLRRWWRRSAPRHLRSLARARLPLAKAAALSVAVGILSLLMPSIHHLDAIAIGLYGLGVILLTAPVDARVVRYMTLVGHGDTSLLRYWVPIQLALLWPAALALLMGQAWVPAGVAAVVAVALPVVTALRIFAYRALNRLIADWAVAIVILAAVYAGLTAPPLGPMILVGAIVWLARRGSKVAAGMSAALDITGLNVSRGGQPVVQDVSAAVKPASWFGVIGANGSGKTTLLRAIAGRLPIAQGSCAIFGEECARDRGARAQAIGFAPPIEHFPASLRLRQLLELAGDPLDDQRERNRDLWDSLGLQELLDIPAGECSSGMRQRAAIALAFAMPCRIVILDEPFNWLDPVAAFDVRAALARLVAEGLALVTALHDLSTLCGFCDSGIVMAKGRVSLTLDTAMLRAGRNDSARFESNLVAALR